MSLCGKAEFIDVLAARREVEPPPGRLILPLTVLAAALAPPLAAGWSLEGALVNWAKSSKLLADLHAQHVAAPQAQHMMKATPLVDAPDDAKMDFANGFAGKMVATMMEKEQMLLGDWKLEKIVEAAGTDFDGAAHHKKLVEVLEAAPVALFSFVDCPWCLLAKQLLKEVYGLEHGDGTLQVIELEELGPEGKRLRAAIALASGRTSMPACFIDGLSIGGYTDGFAIPPDEAGDSGFTYVPPHEIDLRRVGSPGLAKLHESGELAALLGELI
ncbi:hypothetical protein ACHAXT_001743 [Thalassiosira profunda]